MIILSVVVAVLVVVVWLMFRKQVDLVDQLEKNAREVRNNDFKICKNIAYYVNDFNERTLIQVPVIQREGNTVEVKEISIRKALELLMKHLNIKLLMVEEFKVSSAQEEVRRRK